MNSKVYRLLRNNKEQGPFTAQELAAKNLKPFDLIWVDGRSAAWSYPGELAEFKMYVDEPTEKPTINVLQKQDEVVTKNASAKTIALNDVINIEKPKQKPRYKVSAAWSKIQTITTPLYRDVMVAEPKKISAAKILDIQKTQPAVSKSLSWEQAWRDWENEKQTVKPAEKQVAQKSYIDTNINKNTAPVLEKKFEQSLDNITNNYIDNLLQQKKKSTGFQLGKASEFILPSLALIIIFSIAYWFMHDTKITALPSAQPVNQQSTAPVKDEKTSFNATNALTNNTTVKPGNTNNVIAKIPAKQKAYKTYASNTNIVAPVKQSKVANNVVAKKPSQVNTSNIVDINPKKNANPAAKQFDPTVINNIPKDNTYNDASATNNGDINSNENRPVRRRTNADVTDNTSSNQAGANASSAKNTNTQTGLNYVSVPEYISMDDGSGNIKIQNVSDVDLDLAVIDVQYFDASGRFHKGETLYLHNLKAGKTLTIKTAKDINSAYATAKVSLVSSDANGVYAVGDN